MVRQSPSLAEPQLQGQIVDRGRVATALGLGSVVAVGAVTRATLLDQVMRRDEAQSYLQFAGSFASALTDYSQPNNHILHSMLVRVSTLLFGGDPWAIRLPAYLFGVALIGVVFWWAASMGGRRAGLLAAALVAGSSMMIEYSTIARGYTMVAVAFVVLMELSRRILLQSRLGLWVGWVVVAVLGFATVPIFVFPFLAVVTWLVLNIVGRPRHRRPRLPRRRRRDVRSRSRLSGLSPRRSRERGRGHRGQ